MRGVGWGGLVGRWGVGRSAEDVCGGGCDVIFLAAGTPLCALTPPLLPLCLLLCLMLSSDFRSTLPRER